METTPAHVHHRIAEAVGNGWPGYDLTEAEIEEIIEKHNRLTDDAAAICIAMERRPPVMAVEAVLAEAQTYGLLREWAA